MTKKNTQVFAAVLMAIVLGAASHQVAAQVVIDRIDLPAAIGMHGIRTAGPGRRAGEPPLQRSLISPGAAHLVIESGPVSFGEVIAGRSEERNDALSVRVFSDSDWELRLIPESAINTNSRADSPSMSLLEWKHTGSGKWMRLRSGAPVVVGRGQRTGPSGQPVSVDLRLQLSDRDPIGQYGFNLRLSLETDR
jgi:hypothetical protein